MNGLKTKKLKLQKGANGYLADVGNLASRIFKHEKMAEDFPLLFSPDNVENIYIARDGDEVVGMLPTLLGRYFSAGCFYNVVFFGAVCVDEAYRGLNIIDDLIQMVYQDFAHFDNLIYQISGFKRVYLKNGAQVIGHQKSRRFKGQELLGDTRALTLTDANLRMMYQLYYDQPEFYIQDYNNFKKLSIACLACKYNREAKVYGLYQADKLCAYMFVNRTDDGYETISAVGPIDDLCILANDVAVLNQVAVNLRHNDLKADFVLENHENTFYGQAVNVDDIKLIQPGIFRQ